MNNFYCFYCHSNICNNEAYVVDPEERIYHVQCYVQMSTYSDDFGNYTVQEYDAEEENE